jgi:hypothetical protein
MNIITTIQLAAICADAVTKANRRPVIKGTYLTEADCLPFVNELARAQPGDYVHIGMGAMGQDDYMALDQFIDGQRVWETEPQQYGDPDEFAAEMLRHHG